MSSVSTRFVVRHRETDADVDALLIRVEKWKTSLLRIQKNVAYSPLRARDGNTALGVLPRDAGEEQLDRSSSERAGCEAAGHN